MTPPPLAPPPIDFDRWPRDENDLIVRMKFYWSRTWWILA